MASTRLLIRSAQLDKPSRLGRSGAIGLSRVVACRRQLDVAVKATVAAAPESVITVEPWWDRPVKLGSEMVAGAAEGVLDWLRTAAAAKSRLRKVDVQMMLERAIIDCRFFTWLAVAGTLLGSILCFVEGCFMVLESYIQYFQTMSQISNQGQVIQLLIEALDMFLMGTAMLIFGVSLHVIFVGSKGNPRTEKAWLPGSSLFGLYYLSGLPSWVEQQSISQAKSKIGHAVMIILQVGMLEKFKSIPISTSLDLACFAGALLLSSACIFLLSRLSFNGRVAEDHQ